MRASHNPLIPIADQPGGLWVQRAIGAVTLFLGLTLAVLLAFSTFTLVARGGATLTPALIFCAVIGTLSAFFVSVGVRMSFNRPNRHGSLLTPALWFAIAALFFTCAVFIASTLLATRQFAKLEVAGYAFAFAALAVMAGRRAMKKRGRVS
ncbi:hypothetical protein [Roseateles sp. P5_E11]